MAAVPSWWREAITDTDRRVAMLRRKYPQLVVTSRWRTRKRNASVGGKPKSQHLVGTAVDLDARDRSVFKPAATYARKLGLVVFNEGDHLHVQLFPGGVIPTWVYDALSV